MSVETKRDAGEVTLTITVPAEKVKETFDELKKAALKEVEVSGFRKGKAPEKVASKHLDEDKLAQELFNRLVPTSYAEALQSEGIKPIVVPQISVKEYQKDKDLVFEAKTAERPEVKLGKYKQALKGLKGQTIYGPEGKPVKGKPKITAAQILEVLREAVDVKVPAIIADQEVQRMMSSLLDQAQTLGITVDQYLESQGKTVDQLRKEARETAERNIKDELIVTEVAQQEGIKASQKELEDAIRAAPDEKTREAFSAPRGKEYIGDILRKRKTIEFLMQIAEGK